MSINQKKIKKFIGVLAVALGAVFVGMRIVAKKKKKDSVYDNEPEQKNPMAGKKVVFVEDEDGKENADGAKGHLEAVGDSEYHPGFYDKYVKRAADIVLSFGGLVALSPLFLAITVAIKIDDPGPVLFTQKRIGQNKEYFKLHKFRSMKMFTPHDVPTHMLDNPEQYITRVGKFLRKHSLDELPQIWDIFIGNMSVIGPRPGLWNQDVLTAERDKYGANDVKPGLTGLAQISGRDELEIPDKAKLDGEYVEHLGLAMDIKCFLGSLHVFGKDDSVVEGGTGEMHKVDRHYTDGKSSSELIGQIGFSKPVEVDTGSHRKVLVTGVGSYIGESFKAYAEVNYKDSFEIDAVDMLDPNWRETDFSKYDIVYHVAGIAHADVGNVDEATKEKYYVVNTDLAVEVCRIVKEAGVKEFIFMSSMIVYGESAGFGRKKVIDRNTVPKPANFYGDSKLQADVAIRDLAGENFTVIVLRPPMIYGKGSKGNYPMLAKLAKKLPVFPDVDNERSILHIDNLCEFLCQIMLVNSPDQAVVLIPQNGEWTKTSRMVQEIAGVSGKKIRLVKGMKPAVALGGRVPGKIGRLVNKAFGNSCYAQEMSRYEGINYQRFDFDSTILKTEGSNPVDKDNHASSSEKKHILVVSQYFYPETLRINDICQEWIKRGYKVTVVTGIPNYPRGEYYNGYSKTERREEVWNGIEIIRLPIEARGHNSVGLIKNYISFVLEGKKWANRTDVKCDIVFTYEVSPMTQALVSVWYAKRNRIPHVLYITDLWPENVEIITGIHNKIFLGSIQKMVDYIYTRSDRILTSSNSFVKAIEKRKIPGNKIEFWPQYAEDFYTPIMCSTIEEIPQDGIFNMIFAGNIGYAQGLGILVSAASTLKQQGEKVRFNIIGDGRYLQEFRDSVAEKKVEEYFNFINRKKPEEIPNYLAIGDALLITLSKSEVFSITIPAKTQSCLACGKPILVSADGEVQDIIREAQAGLSSDAEDVDGLVHNIIMMSRMSKDELNEFAENALSYSIKHFDKNMLLDRIDEIFKEI